MDAQEIIDQVRSELDEPIPGFWTNNELLGWINRAERDFNNRTHVLDGKSVTGTIAGTTIYPLPSNCVSVKAVMYNDANTGSGASPNWRRVVPSNLEKTIQQTPNFLSNASGTLGAPASYAIWDRSLYLQPTPDVSDDNNLVLFFKAKPIPLTDASQQLNVDDSFEEGIIAYVLWKAYKKEKEFDLAAEQEAIYEAYIRQGLRWQKKQSGDQRNRLDIDSPTPFQGPYDVRFNPLS